MHHGTVFRRACIRCSLAWRYVWSRACATPEKHPCPRGLFQCRGGTDGTRLRRTSGLWLRFLRPTSFSISASAMMRGKWRTGRSVVRPSCWRGSGFEVHAPPRGRMRGMRIRPGGGSGYFLPGCFCMAANSRCACSSFAFNSADAALLLSSSASSEVVPAFAASSWVLSWFLATSA